MSRSFPLLFLSLLVVCSCLPLSLGSSDSDLADSTAAAGPEVVPFQAYDYLQGEWEVYRHVVSYTDGAVHTAHSLPVVHWRLEKENNTQNLFGRGWVNGTNEYEGLAIRVEFQDGTSGGQFQTGVDEDQLSTLFDFAFQQVKGSVPMSAGTWNGAEVAGDAKATYIMQAASPDRFTITVTPRNFNLAQASKAPAKVKKPAASEDEDEFGASGPAATGHPFLSVDELVGAESFIYVGHRVKNEPEKTFFQKYSTMLLLGGMLLLNVYMRTKQSAGAMTAQQAARTNVQAAAQRSVASKKSGAKLEDITEGEISVGADQKKGQ